jgi:hypothetical protein
MARRCIRASHAIPSQHHPTCEAAEAWPRQNSRGHAAATGLTGAPCRGRRPGAFIGLREIQHPLAW